MWETLVQATENESNLSAGPVLTVMVKCMLPQYFVQLAQKNVHTLWL